MSDRSLTSLHALLLLCGACNATTGQRPPGEAPPGAVTFRAPASSDFWRHWGDGKAELSGYRVTAERYGALREGHAVLIYVTEPLDARTWIKDDAGNVPQAHRVNVLKLNHMLHFRTGIYPYGVMTSVFAPVDRLREREAFAPVKIAISVQEWCGHVFHKVQPQARRFTGEIRSYFQREGEAATSTPTPAGALYEDALLIQLRELDEPFAGGKDFAGALVRSLWSARKAHVALVPRQARISRGDAERAGRPVTRFVMQLGDYRRTIDVEKAAPRRVLGWSDSQGERAELLKTARLPYWQLNARGHESYLEALGLGPAATR